jgi:hypothetical protein
MAISGGCYCKELRYLVTGDIEASIQCHCRECQYITGGNANTLITISMKTFKFTKGTPKSFERTDIANPVKRFFCGTCGTAIGTKSPKRPGSMILKVGTFDDPSIYKPETAIFTIDKQEFHYIADDVIQFKKRP